MTVATNKNRVSTYISDDLKRDGEKLAEIEQRSLSSLIAILLQRAVDEAKQEGRL